MGCKKIQLEYFESLRTSQTSSLRFVNAINKKNPYTYDDNVANIFIIKTIIYALIDLISLRILFSINKKSIQFYTYDACELRKNQFLATEITKKTQKPASFAKLSSLSCPQRKMQSLRTSQTINGLIPANYAKPTSIIKISISCYYGLRYYNSNLGRWINRDPIGEQGGLNLYQFCSNDSIGSWDYLGMWKATEDSKGKARRTYLFESGDTKKKLADILNLDESEFDKWAKKECNNQDPTTNLYCKYSVPNVWISADLMQGGGIWDRIKNIGGSIGTTVGTGMFTSSDYKIVNVNSVPQLYTELKSNVKSMWGFVLFGHGNKGGTIVQSNAGAIIVKRKAFLDPKEKGKKWTTQTILMGKIDKNGYKLSKIYLMQCYSAYGGYGNMWRTRAKIFFGYEGLNVIGLDVGGDYKKNNGPKIPKTRNKNDILD